MEQIRKMAAVGSFYPAWCYRIKQIISHYNRLTKTRELLEVFKDIHPKAVVVPHAGYVYSGFTANLAYRMFQPAQNKRFIVIGPSHKYYFQGISGSFFETYETPCGVLEIDSAYLFALAKRFDIGFIPQAHAKEHSTEVQMPFIQYYFPQNNVIELIYGDIRIEKLANIISALLQNPENRLIISSDLSHFYPLEKANELDAHCIKGIQKLDLNELKQCEACGDTGIKALILAAKHLKLLSKVLYHTTSVDYSHDPHSVVGYLSAAFY